MSRDETGAVAVLVAVMMSAVLFVVGALAVDLGSLWAARAGLRAVADAAALAGATHLPSDPAEDALADPVKDAVVTAAVAVVCADGNRRPQWGSETDCAEAAWAKDTDPDNGQVTIVRSPPEDYGIPDTEPERAPWLVVVTTPPVHVGFGLARAAGKEGADVAARSGARRGLPYPAGSSMALQTSALWAGSPYSPYYVTVADLEAAHGDALGQICLRTLPRTGGALPSRPPRGDSGFLFGSWERTPDGASVIGDTDSNGLPDVANAGPTTFTVTRAVLGTPPPDVVAADSIAVYVGRQDADHRAATVDVQPDPDVPGTWRITFTTWDLSVRPMFGQVPVWWVWTRTDGTSTTTRTSRRARSALLEFPPSTSVATSDCDPLAAGRGLVDATALDAADSPRAAVAGGLRTSLAPFGSSPQAQQPPERDTTCTSRPGATAVPDVIGGPAPDGANCITLLPSASVSAADLTSAWLDAGPDSGRLRSTCGNGSMGTISGLSGEFDRTELFSSSNGLLARGVSTFGLRSRIRAGLAADPAYTRAITEAVFDCPRLLLVPVLDATPPASTSIRQAVVGFTYFWVSDTQSRDGRGRALRGLMVTPSLQVVGIRGWAIDPGYVQGGDWVPHTRDAADALPWSQPRRAVLVRTPCDDHPASTCPP